jgi:hypothetical protein
MHTCKLAWITVAMLAGLVLTGRPSRAQDYGCKNYCNAMTCNNECVYNNAPTTCLDWYDRFGDDGDGDGVPTDSDNCPCGSNADQADCDGDGVGDICDSLNEKWVFVQNLGECDIDEHATGTEWDVQRIGAIRYRNVCNNTYCSDRYVIEEKSCTFSFVGCGKGYLECCDCSFTYSSCHQLNTCGGPDCPF